MCEERFPSRIFLGKTWERTAVADFPVKLHRINGPYVLVRSHNPKDPGSNPPPASIHHVCSQELARTGQAHCLWVHYPKVVGSNTIPTISSHLIPQGLAQVEEVLFPYVFDCSMVNSSAPTCPRAPLHVIFLEPISGC